MSRPASARALRRPRARRIFCATQRSGDSYATSARIGTAGGAVKAAIARPSRLPYAARRGHRRSFMPMRRHCAVMVLIVLSACTQSNHAQQSATTRPEFAPIFNGKDLSGWAYGTTNDEANKKGEGYRVRDGAIYCTATDGGNLFT